MQGMKSWMAITGSVLALILTSCTRGCATSEPSVLVIDGYRITKTAISQRDEVARIYYPQNTTSVGLKQLSDAYLTASVLRRNGHEIDDVVLQKEAERIEKNTLMPEMLARIQAIFGKDREAYKMVFVLPTYAERTIYFDFFLRNSALQANSRRVAEEFLRRALASPQRFAELVAADKKTLAPFTVSLHEGIKWQNTDESAAQVSGAGAREMPPGLSKEIAARQERTQSAEGKRWIQDIVNNLKPGEIWNAVLDAGEQWQIVRYKGPKGDAHALEAVFFAKADFQKWFDAEKSQVPVKVIDPEATRNLQLPGESKSGP